MGGQSQDGLHRGRGALTSQPLQSTQIIDRHVVFRPADTTVDLCQAWSRSVALGRAWSRSADIAVALGRARSRSADIAVVFGRARSRSTDIAVALGRDLQTYLLRLVAICRQRVRHLLTSTSLEEHMPAYAFLSGVQPILRCRPIATKPRQDVYQALPTSAAISALMYPVPFGAAFAW